MVRIPIPVEDQIFLVHPFKGVSILVIHAVFREEGSDTPCLRPEFDGRAIPQPDRFCEANFRKAARPVFRISLLTEEIPALPEGKVRAPSGQVKPGVEFIASPTGSFNAGVRLVVAREIGEADSELIPPGEGWEIAGGFHDQLRAGGDNEVVACLERPVEFEQRLPVAHPVGLSVEMQGAKLQLSGIPDVETVGRGASKGLFPVDKQVLPIELGIH